MAGNAALRRPNVVALYGAPSIQPERPALSRPGFRSPRWWRWLLHQRLSRLHDLLRKRLPHERRGLGFVIDVPLRQQAVELRPAVADQVQAEDIIGARLFESLVQVDRRRDQP